LPLLVSTADRHEPPHPVASGAPARPLLGIQYLRAVGALLILFFHMTIQLPLYTGYFKSHLLGQLHLANGVDLFFVVSGLIMMMSGRDATPGDFIVRRMIRIIPMYWILTSLLAVLLYRNPELFHNTTLSLEYFLKSLGFIPYPNPAQNGQFFPLLVPGWSLNFEMFFYTLFACTLFLPYGSRLLVMGGAFGALLAIAPWVHSPAVSFFADLRLLELWLGMLIASLFLDVKLRLHPTVAAVIAALGFAWLLLGFPAAAATETHLRFLLDSVLPAATVVFAVVSLDLGNRISKSSRFELLGDASYSIYLTHIFSLGVVRVVWVEAGLARDLPLLAAAFALVSCAFAVAAAVLVYRNVELPLLLRLQQAYKSRRTRRLEGRLCLNQESGGRNPMSSR
jgi:exopolysaccharide production protein ExoZ